MNFYQTTKLIVFLLIPAVLIGLIFLIFTGQVGVYDTLYYISSPLLKITGSAGKWLASAGDFIFKFKSISGENERLKEENYALLSRLAEMGEIKNENAVLKNQLGQTGESAGKKSVFVEIIGRSFSLGEKTIVINKGKRDGVSEGAPFIYGKFMAAKILKVYAGYSVAALLGDPSLKISAVAQDSRAQGIVSEKNGVLTLGEVPKDKILVPGELVATLGFDGLPKGLILGEIAEISNADNELFQSAVIRPLLDVSGIESGFVIISDN